MSIAATSSVPPKEWAKVTSNSRLKAGQFVLLDNSLEEKKEAPQPEQEIPAELVSTMRSWIIFKDSHIIVLNKPNKVSVQGKPIYSL